MEKKKKVGRKSLYSTKVEPYFDQIRMWRQDGQTEENISKLLGVSYRTFCDYKTKYPQLIQVLKESKEQLIADLERTLFQMALGKGSVTKSKKKYVRDPRTGKMELESEEIQEDQYKPNSTLLIFSLKNLAGNKWQDKHYNENNNTVSNVEELKSIAETLSNLGAKGIDKSQFDDDGDDDEPCTE